MTVTAFRVTHKRFARTAFDGEGARLNGGRWNHEGTAMVYAAGSRALAALELLVHLESPEAIQQEFCCLRVEFPAARCDHLETSRLPRGWNRHPAGDATQCIGDAWIAAGTSLALAVPSTVIAGEVIYLLNPAHPDYSTLVIHPPEAFVFDPRLVKTRPARRGNV